jgi:hypothetical protein
VLPYSQMVRAVCYVGWDKKRPVSDDSGGLNFMPERVIIKWCDQIAIITYLQKRIAHEADGTTVGDGDVPEPLFTGVSDTRPAGRWEARHKIGSATNSALAPDVRRPSGLAKANCMGPSIVTP